MLTHIDLFAGIGGFSLGFQRSGILTVAYVEKDKACMNALKHHHPNALFFDDVKDVGKHNLPYADIITFGSPCQGLSIAGKREGLADERSGLFWEAIRIVKELKPAFAVWENVPGAYTSNNGRDFANVLAAFHECGALDIGWATLDSQHFGVAQRRRRCFLVTDFRGKRVGQILFEPASGTGDTQTSRAAGQGTSPYVIKGAAIGRRPQNGPQRGEISADSTCYTLNASEVHAVTGTLAASGAGTARSGNAYNEASFLIPVVAEAIDVRNLKSNGGISGTLQSKKSGGYSLNYQNPIAFMAGQGSKARSIAASETVSPTLKGVASGTNQVPSVAFALRDDITPKVSEGVSFTLQTPSPSGGGHPMAVFTPAYGVRRLTPVETERLQGFPDGWTAVKGAADGTRYRQTGNAVTVNVAEWLGQQIMQAELNTLFGLAQ